MTHPVETTPAVPAGVDQVELCTAPSPTGRICLQRLADNLPGVVCDDCRDLLAHLVASMMEDRP